VVLLSMSDTQQNWLLAISGLIISSLLAYLLFARQLRDPRPMYVVTGNLVVEGREEDDIDIFHDGRPVPRVTRTLIVLWNSGRGSIRREDVRRPITFTTPDEQVLRANVVTSTRDETGVAFSVPTLDSVEISFSHLDDLDGFCLEILHTGSDPFDVKSSGIIVGVKRGLRLVRSPLYRDDRFAIAVSGMALVVFAIAVASTVQSDWIYAGIGFIIATIFSLIAVAVWRLNPRSLPRGLRELDLPRAPRYAVGPFKAVWIGLRGWQ
jgi:hypothetical protein